MYRTLIRPILFRLDPERVHDATIRTGELLGATAVGRAMLRRSYGFEHPRLRTSVAGIEFPAPLGLAAGFDKSGRAAPALAATGFGFIEVGSVSAHPSTGNPERPRLFRLPNDEAVLVYYGVPNDGAHAVAARLQRSPINVPLGVNLVETNTGQPATPEHTIRDMVEAAGPFLGIADYLALNLNCPNTTGGTSPFDDPARLRELLTGYADYDNLPPVFLKVTATADPARIDPVLEAIDAFPFVRGISFNVPPGKPYDHLKTPRDQLDRLPGTLTGRPTRQLVNAATAAWHQRIDRSRHALIAAGGIASAEDAYEKIRLGASLVQLYTALIYHGPRLPGDIQRGLIRLMDRDGFNSITEAVGTADLASTRTTITPS